MQYGDRLLARPLETAECLDPLRGDCRALGIGSRWATWNNAHSSDVESGLQLEMTSRLAKQYV